LPRPTASVGETAELTVTAESPLVGMSIGEVEQLHGAPMILAIKSGNDARMAPPADHVIWVGSVLGVLGPREQLTQFANNQLCRCRPRMRQLGELFNPTPRRHFRSGDSAELAFHQADRWASCACASALAFRCWR
jgi:hypothetical protein